MLKKFFEDFKAFAMKGNVVDMAIGVVVGGAFGKVVTSVVTDLISPLIGLLVGGAQLSELKWVMRAETVDEAGEVITPAAVLTYGAFLQTIVDFLIIALSIFIVIRVVSKAGEKLKALTKKQEEEAKPEEHAAPVEDELSVLKEIKALLAAEKGESEKN